MIIAGNSISPGLAEGDSLLLDTRTLLETAQEVASQLSVEGELERLRSAQIRAVAQLETMERQLTARGSGNDSVIFATHAALLADKQLTHGIESRIRENHLSPEAATALVVLDMEIQFAASKSVLLQDKVTDILDIGRRLIRCLMTSADMEIAANCIVVAHSLTPSDIVQLAHQGVVGIVTESCGMKSHTAILARGFGLPMVSGLPGITQSIPNGVPVLIDGTSGEVLVEPTADERRKVEFAFAEKHVRHRDFQPSTTAPVSRDGVQVTVLLNISDAIEAQAVDKLGASGVGLYRTEFSYLDRQSWPTADDSYAVYAEVARSIGDGELHIRLADFGAEKRPAYADIPQSRNPSLGIRGVRLLLRRDDILRPQVQAIHRLALQRPLTVLLPMVDSTDVLDAITGRMCHHCDVARRDALPFRLGLMVEVPSAALGIEDLIDSVDSLSIGLNDLTQYLLAADRDDEIVEAFHDALQPSVLRLVKHVMDVARGCDKPVTMCGELAGNPPLAKLLLGLGARRFSVSQANFVDTLLLIRDSDIQHLASLADKALDVRTNKAIRLSLTKSELTPGKRGDEQETPPKTP